MRNSPDHLPFSGRGIGGRPPRATALHLRGSRLLGDVSCATLSALFNLCLTDEDLSTLGVWREERNGLGYTPRVWCRALLHKICRREAAIGRRVADLLDLRHLDTVDLVRAMEAAEVEQCLDLWLEDLDGRVLPGLVWALCTDARRRVQALGSRLCNEALARACRVLTATPTNHQGLES